MSNYQTILNNFLNQWPLEKVEKMTLEEYVSTGDPTTFTQWVENRTIELGSISGLFGSRMFGIYKRKKIEPLAKYYNDDSYTWSKQYGDNRTDAFLMVKENVVKTIKFSLTGEFSKIDAIALPDIFKWKVAYLYSNERLIPIFNRDVLNKIAKNYEMSTNSKTTVSEIQEKLIEKKPIEWTSHEFMIVLWQKFGPQKTNSKSSNGTKKDKNIEDQERSGVESYLAKQTHNKIQNKLKNILIEEYGEDCVECEKNYVDLTLTHNDTITLYEVKSDAYAATCIRQALGQIIQYAHRLDSDKKLKLYVVGQYPLKENEISYLAYIQRNLKIDIDYMNIDLT
ncbi:hypothetical protein ABE427_01900 [Acinetobacter higginsii]|uniref:hypothetical protein n=1 Tax=Acinetobacter higginsii TaxID=70347 RepID=UPI0032080BD0